MTPARARNPGAATAPSAEQPRADRSRARRLGRVAAILALAGSAGPLGADAPGRPTYTAISIGANATPDVAVASRSDDRSSVCDEYINPRALLVPGCVAPERGAGDGWLAPFDGGMGFSGEAELGYRLTPRIRVAVAYAYNATHFDQTVASTDAAGADFDKISDELAVGQETLGTAISHELFLTAFRDWPNRTRWTPYVGAGVGVSRVRKDFSWLWARSPDPADIATGTDQPNAAEIRRNLAGTVSAGRRALRDSMLGYTFVAGVDRAVSETLSLGFSARWKRFGAFESARYAGELLRSHAPNLRLDGSEPVGTWSETGDTGRFSLMLTARYAMSRAGRQ